MGPPKREREKWASIVHFLRVNSNDPPSWSLNTMLNYLLYSHKMCAVVKNYEYLLGKNRSSFNLWPFSITRGTTGSLANTMLQKMAINGNYHLSTSLISSNWFFSGSMFLLGKHFLQSRNICYQLINRNIKNRRYFYKTTDTLFTWMWLNWTNHVHMVFTFTFFLSLTKTTNHSFFSQTWDCLPALSIYWKIIITSLKCLECKWFFVIHISR